VTYADASVQHVALHTGFRSWFSDNINPDAANPLSSASYKVWGVNVPANKAIKQIELLETPEVYKGFPAAAKIIASRIVS
jgi:hypothetical protein